MSATPAAEPIESSEPPTPAVSVTFKPSPDEGLPGESRWGAGFSLGFDVKTK